MNVVHLTPIFSTPICALELPNAERLNRELRSLLLSKEGDATANRYTSMTIPKGLFESEVSLFSWPDAPIVHLRAQVWQAISAYVATLNGYQIADLNNIHINSHTWFHITRRGGYFSLHNHPMASVSGVYCVHGGTSDPDQPNSGMLRFHSPLAPVNMFIDLGNARLSGEFSQSPYAFSLRAGQLILFPSWIMHEVLPFFGDDERITIAFNCWFESKKGA